MLGVEPYDAVAERQASYTTEIGEPMCALSRAAWLAVLSLSVSTGCGTKLPKADAQNVQNYANMDQLQDELAARAANRIGSARDFQIVVTHADFPIGTLIRRSTTIPIDYYACTPGDLPPKSSTPSLFPAYSISKSLAVNFGLDDQATSQITQLGFDLGEGSEITLSVASPNIQAMSDSDVVAAATTPDCLSHLANGPAWLVRGYISGIRSFMINAEGKATANAAVNRIGSFRVDFGSGSSSLRLTDEGETAFLQIVSEVDSPGARRVSEIRRPEAHNEPGMIYIQEGVGDTSGSRDWISAIVRSMGLNVAAPVEPIPQEHMPESAEVRYFNDNDRSTAARITERVKDRFPSARMTQIGLPAPQGQIEIWLNPPG